MLSDGTSCQDDDPNKPYCEGDSCETPDPIDPDPTPDPAPDPDPTPDPDPDPIDELDPKLVSYDVACGSYFYDEGNVKGWNGKCDGSLYVPDYTEPLNNLKGVMQDARRLSFGNAQALEHLKKTVDTLPSDINNAMEVSENRLIERMDDTMSSANSTIVTRLDTMISGGVSLIPETNTKLEEIYVEARLANLNAFSAMSSNSRILGIEQLLFMEVMPSLNTLKSDTTDLRKSSAKLSKDTAENFTTTNGKIDSLDSTTSGNFDATNTKIDGLADGLKALSEQISAGSGTGSDDVDLSGIESRLKGIQDTLNGVGLSGRAFEGQVDFEGNGLYGSEAIDKLQGEIEQLQEQYQEQMGQFKSLFTFDESQLNSGEYVKHEWTFTFANGRTNSFSSGVFPALLQNANFIAAVLLFLAVLLGIKALTD
ncbi:hypothetical protein [Vibrio fluvialis]|uniref:hypothetical protein n=1 Tax=Vibrio fluvialis TaxID=676 RepID=UPI001F19FCA1|nr:hypothetical protein [Vibrio fluvialis]MCE7620160.1 hypothetical protein [Vibrio fluvialis]MCE7628359.1 hypothetical protein [Vibrio fluvialis]